MSTKALSNDELVRLTSTPQGLQIIHFHNDEFVTLHIDNSTTAYKVWAKPRIQGATPTHIATIAFNRSFPKLRPVHLRAILDFIDNNFPTTEA